tara:strand:+ start:538 stop:1509 length:972 start_codon:yes stop_codon:yes gene_type:complete
MNNTKKTIFFIFIAFAFSSSIFLFIMSSLPDYTYLQHKEFYSQVIPEEKIFIFGSSQVYAINPIHVSDYLLDQGHNYAVYNLGQGSFDAEERLRTIDLIISQEPNIVIYGISYQTFYSHGRNIVEKPTESFPSPPKVIDLLSSISLPFNSGLLDNPKFATINTFNHIYKLQTGNFEETPNRPYPNTPFFRYTPTEPAHQKDLEVGGNAVNYKGSEIYPINKNRTYAALKELIHNLHDNNIQVIIFTTPHLENWLIQLPEQQKQIFGSMLDDLEKEFDFEVFRLHDKYQSLDIWADHDHLVSHSSKTDFYSEDIAKILLTRIDE